MQNLHEWLAFYHLDFIQLIVLTLGVSEVLLARNNNVWLYPAGIAATFLSIYSLFGAQLYAECLLHLYYIGMSFYGWWYWLHQQNSQKTEVSFANRKDWVMTASIAFGGWIVLYLFLIYFTPSHVPAWDAWISSTGWAGMWLLARRKVENWIVLNISNAFAIPLLFQKDLPLFAVLTIFLFVVACVGYYDWVKIARRHRVTT